VAVVERFLAELGENVMDRFFRHEWADDTQKDIGVKLKQRSDSFLAKLFKSGKKGIKMLSLSVDTSAVFLRSSLHSHGEGLPRWASVEFDESHVGAGR